MLDVLEINGCWSEYRKDSMYQNRDAEVGAEREEGQRGDLLAKGSEGSRPKQMIGCCYPMRAKT